MVYIYIYIYTGHCYTTTFATRDGVCLDQNTNPHFFFCMCLIASCLLVCLILFPSVGITVVQHCNTVGIHRSFPLGVV